MYEGPLLSGRREEVSQGKSYAFLGTWLGERALTVAYYQLVRNHFSISFTIWAVLVQSAPTDPDLLGREETWGQKQRPSYFSGRAFQVLLMPCAHPRKELSLKMEG